MKALTNNVEVRPQVPAVDIKRKIEEALRRAAELDASRITVETNGSEVILQGTVRSWAERKALSERHGVRPVSVTWRTT